MFAVPRTVTEDVLAGLNGGSPARAVHRVLVCPEPVVDGVLAVPAVSEEDLVNAAGHGLCAEATGKRLGASLSLLVISTERLADEDEEFGFQIGRAGKAGLNERRGAARTASAHLVRQFRIFS